MGFSQTTTHITNTKHQDSVLLNFLVHCFLIITFNHLSVSFICSRNFVFATLKSLTWGLSFEISLKTLHYLPTLSNLHQLSSHGRKLASKFQRVSFPELIIGSQRRNYTPLTPFSSNQLLPLTRPVLQIANERYADCAPNITLITTTCC